MTESKFNFSITTKEFAVLQFLWDNKFITPSVSIKADDLREFVNETLSGGKSEEEEPASSPKVDADHEASGKRPRNGKITISRAVMYRILKKHIEMGTIAEGVKNEFAKTYYLTVLGAEFYANISDISKNQAEKLLAIKEQIESGLSSVLDDEGE